MTGSSLSGQYIELLPLNRFMIGMVALLNL